MATLPFKRCRAGNPPGFHPLFRLWVGMGCSRLLFGRFTSEVAVSVKINFFFLSHRYIWLVRNETSAEKPRGFAVRQESKAIRIKINETKRKKGEEPFF